MKHGAAKRGSTSTAIPTAEAHGQTPTLSQAPGSRAAPNAGHFQKLLKKRHATEGMFNDDALL